MVLIFLTILLILCGAVFFSLSDSPDIVNAFFNKIPIPRRLFERRSTKPNGKQKKSKRQKDDVKW